MAMDGYDYALFINPLHGAIESASIKKKDNKFIVMLRKKTDAPWFQLTNKS
jgi:hypothetical protein